MPRLNGYRSTVLAAIATFGLVAVLAGASLLATHTSRQATRRLQSAAGDLILVERLRGAFEHEVAAGRGFLVTGSREFVEREDAVRRQFRRTLEKLEVSADTPDERHLLADVAAKEAVHRDIMSLAIAQRLAAQGTASIDVVVQDRSLPARDAVGSALRALTAALRQDLVVAEGQSATSTNHATSGVIVISFLALLATVAMTLMQVRASRRERDELEQWTEFLSVASHDIKTPLWTLRLRLQLLLRRLAGDSEAEKVATGMDRQIDRMSELVNRLLDASRLRLGPVSPCLEDVDLSELVARAAERMREQFEQAGSTLKVSCSGRVLGRWDRLRLEEVATNLLSNALKYGEHKPVEVTVDAQGAIARLCVRDHGVGIARADQARVFGRFVRAGADRHPGHGLGLWITRTIVAAHGGQISVQSRPGEGASFVVELPRGEGAGAAQQNAAEPPPHQSAAHVVPW